MGHLSMIMEDSSVKINKEYVGPEKEISEGGNVNNWPRNYFCNIFAKNVDVFCPCPKKI